MSEQTRIENATVMLATLRGLIAEVPPDVDMVVGDEERTGMALLLHSIECMLKGEPM